MARWTKNGTTSDRTQFLLFYWIMIIQVLGKYIYPIKSIFEVVEYRMWLNKTFGKIKCYKTKYSMLEVLAKEVETSGGGNYFEFGVAFGETARFLVKNKGNSSTYHGFDTFMGLPKSWRRLPKGAFTNNGEAPDIVGENIFFHIGLVQDTVKQVTFNSVKKNFYLFDLDLYAPTLFVLQHVENEFKAGDIVYFDEAFDADERVIIENYFLGRHSFDVIGASVLGLAVRIKNSSLDLDN
jgi:hypothetical protein